MRFRGPGAGAAAALLTVAGAVVALLLRDAPRPIAPGPLARPAPGVSAPSSAAPSPSPPPAGSPATSPTPDAATLLAGLDDARVRGYADPVRADVDRWLDQGCRCAREERATLAALVSTGHALRGVRVLRTSVAVAAQAPATLTILVADRLPPYDEIDAVGRVVRRWPGRGELRWRIVLRHAPGGWRIADLRAE